MNATREYLDNPCIATFAELSVGECVALARLGGRVPDGSQLVDYAPDLDELEKNDTWRNPVRLEDAK